MTRDELANHSRNTLGYSERMTQDLLDAYDLGSAAEREACAMIADARAMRCEEKTATAEDDEETELRSLAWQFSVLAAEMRKRSNEHLR